MSLLAFGLGAITILLVGILVGYLWGCEDGRDEGERVTYQAVERWYETRGGR